MTDNNLIVLTDEQIRSLGEAWSCFFQEVGYEDDCIRDIEQAVLQSKQVQAWKKDAERINWIESQYGADIVCLDTEQWEVSSTDAFGEGLILRDAIDAAMEKQT